MKVGFQTIVWWPFTDPLEYRLEVIAAAGYKGVELKERRDELPPIEQLLKLLDKYGLELIGLAGGSLKSRMEYCGTFRPEYLYVEDWSKEVADDADKKDFTLAIHPHVFKPTHGLERAKRLLREDQRLKFLPDTGHLTVAGDEPVDAIKYFADKKDRIAAVHLKDWTPEFGRSAHRYAMGFVELGQGTVDLDGVVNALKEIGYDGWLIVEQDYTKTDPAIDTFRCARWLVDRELLEKQAEKIPEREVGLYKRKPGSKSEARFLESIVSAGWRDIEACYEAVAEAFFRICRCELVTLWTCSPAYELMNLVALKPDVDISDKRVLYCRETLSGRTIEEQSIQRFDLGDNGVKARFGWPKLLEIMEIGQMVSIPVFNPWNPNHVRLVVNIFSNKGNFAIDNERLFRLGVAAGYSTSSALSQVCSACMGKVNICAGKCRRTKEFVYGLAELVTKLVGCDEAGVVLQNPEGNRPYALAHASGQSRRQTEVPWAKCMDRALAGVSGERGTLMLPRPEGLGWHGGRGVDPESRCERLFTQLTGIDGTNLGWICCCGKRTPIESGAFGKSVFCDDDAAVLAAIGEAAVPHFELMVAQERRERTAARLTHEVKVPLGAIRGAAEFIMRTPGVKDFFDYDYPGDIWSWSELMGRLVGNLDAFRYSDEEMPIKPWKIHLLPDVIAPAIRQVRFLLEERRFSKNHISYRGIDEFPEMWLDRNWFQQVVFNLLANAIKYAFDDPKKFKVGIEGAETEAEFIIWFRDWGPGIEPGTECAIFEEGFRGEAADKMNIAGEGLGLWIVRRIARRHSGDVEVSNASWPTEFRISLPYWLTSRKPR